MPLHNSNPDRSVHTECKYASSLSVMMAKHRPNLIPPNNQIGLRCKSFYIILPIGKTFPSHRNWSMRYSTENNAAPVHANMTACLSQRDLANYILCTYT